MGVMGEMGKMGEMGEMGEMGMVYRVVPCIVGWLQIVNQHHDIVPKTFRSVAQLAVHQLGIAQPGGVVVRLRDGARAHHDHSRIRHNVG